MKLKKHKIDEGFMDVVGAINRRMGGSGESQSSRDGRIEVLAKKNFINKFVISTQDSLESAIESNTVAIRSPETASASSERIIPDNGGANESIRFKRLNALFEELIEASEQTESISSYTLRAFKQFMRGVSGLSFIMPQAQALAAKVQDTYTTDKGRAALTKLGHLGWAASANQRADALTEQPLSKTPQTPSTTTAGPSALDSTSVLNFIQNLKKTDIRAYNNLMGQLV